MKFKQIEPSDYHDLRPFFRRQKYELCSYSLASIIAWNSDKYQSLWAVDGDVLIVCSEFAKSPQNRHLILPISPVVEYSPEELHGLAVELGFDKYWFVPGDYLERYGEAHVSNLFSVEEQKEYEDYVYLTDDLAILGGNKYSKKRNLINQFKKTYLDRGRVKIEDITLLNGKECLDFLEKWCEECEYDVNKDEGLACEKQAAINTIKNIDVLGAKGILLRINGIVMAFGVAASITDDMGALHFEKASANVKGLYQFFDRECAIRLFKGCKYINKESGMDIPGLIKSKKSYYPVMMIKSYKLIVR